MIILERKRQLAREVFSRSSTQLGLSQEEIDLYKGMFSHLYWLYEFSRDNEKVDNHIADFMKDPDFEGAIHQLHHFRQMLYEHTEPGNDGIELYLGGAMFLDAAYLLGAVKKLKYDDYQVPPHACVLIGMGDAPLEKDADYYGSFARNILWEKTYLDPLHAIFPYTKHPDKKFLSDSEAEQAVMRAHLFLGAILQRTGVPLDRFIESMFMTVANTFKPEKKGKGYSFIEERLGIAYAGRT